MDKINIVSSQAVLEVSSFSMDTRSKSSSPLINSLIKNRLFKTASDLDDLRLNSNTLWTCSGRHDAALQPRSRNPQEWDLGCLEATGWAQENLVFLAAVQLLHVKIDCLRLHQTSMTVPVHCPARKQSRYQTLCVSLAALLRYGSMHCRFIQQIL